MTLASDISSRARELGFSRIGFTSASPSPTLSAYLSWVENGYHGTMGYLARPDRIERRKDLRAILHNAQSLVIVALDYGGLPLADHISNDPTRAQISNYAWSQDYHDVMLARLEMLVEYLHEHSGDESESLPYVDTGALLERAHAHQARLGFIGKNTMLIHPRHGSYCFLGAIITSVRLHSSATPVTGNIGCGSCTSCLHACPTNAFAAPYVLDARKCISYLTIEYKGYIPAHLRDSMGRWVYGCDICQQVCPWQRFSKPGDLMSSFEPESVSFAAPHIVDLLRLTNAGFQVNYSHSPIARIKRERFVRNACIAAGNSGQISLLDDLMTLLTDESPLVRAHAAWGVVKLTGSTASVRSYLRSESNAEAALDVKTSIDYIAGRP